MKLIEVKWSDAYGDGGRWQDESELRCGIVYVRTVGWLVDEDEAGVSLAQSWARDDGTNAYFNYMNIPRGMIMEVNDLGDREPLEE